VIPDDALLKINVRTFDEEVRGRVLASIERIVNAEASAAGAPKLPEISYGEHFALTTNDRSRRYASRTRFASTSGPARSTSSRTRCRSARTSGRSAASGASRRSSGRSTAPTPTSTGQSAPSRASAGSPQLGTTVCAGPWPASARDRGGGVLDALRDPAGTAALGRPRTWPPRRRCRVGRRGVARRRT
jgi:hypothetical protein